MSGAHRLHVDLLAASVGLQRLHHQEVAMGAVAQHRLPLPAAPYPWENVRRTFGSRRSRPVAGTAASPRNRACATGIQAAVRLTRAVM